MAVHVLHDREAHTAALYDSVTGTAFGVVFEDDPEHGLDAADAAHAFLGWLAPNDARSLSPVTLNAIREDWLDSLTAPVAS